MKNIGYNSKEWNKYDDIRIKWVVGGLLQASSNYALDICEKEISAELLSQFKNKNISNIWRIISLIFEINVNINLNLPSEWSIFEPKSKYPIMNRIFSNFFEWIIKSENIKFKKPISDEIVINFSKEKYSSEDIIKTYIFLLRKYKADYQPGTEIEMKKNTRIFSPINVKCSLNILEIIASIWKELKNHLDNWEEQTILIKNKTEIFEVVNSILSMYTKIIPSLSLLKLRNNLYPFK
jgi:hypothetical protein